MGISKLVARWLTSQGHNASHLDFEKLFNLPDNLILEKAISENRIILTSDMDFGQLVAIDSTKQASIIQFRLSDFTAANVIAKLDEIFQDRPGLLEGNFILTVEDNRVRFRKLPI